MGDFMSQLGGVASNLGSAAETGLSGLGNFFGSPAGRATSDLGTFGLGLVNAFDQRNLYDRIMANAKQSAPWQTFENIKQKVEGQNMGSIGSAVPAQIGAQEALADYAVLSDEQKNQLAAYQTMAGMPSSVGSLEQLLAQITGGLGGSYANFMSPLNDPTLNSAWGNVLSDPNAVPYSGDPSTYYTPQGNPFDVGQMTKNWGTYYTGGGG